MRSELVAAARAWASVGFWAFAPPPLVAAQRLRALGAGMSSAAAFGAAPRRCGGRARSAIAPGENDGSAAPAATTIAAASAAHPARLLTGATAGTITTGATHAKGVIRRPQKVRETPQDRLHACRTLSYQGRHPAEEARVDEQSRTADDSGVPFGEAAAESLDQPEDEATEHALRLMDEALRRDDAGRRWLVAGDP